MTAIDHDPTQHRFDEPADPQFLRAAERRITAHFDDLAPRYHATAFDGAGMAYLSERDLACVERSVALARDVVSRRGDDVVTACDVGVGTGRISGAVLAAGCDLTGVDASPAMLAQAAPKLRGADLRHGSLADRLPVDDGSFDLVTCLRVVKYLPAWPRAVAELARIARPGGIVCFDLANDHSAARFGYPSGMVWGATYPAALAAIAAAGLDVVEVVNGVHLPDPVWQRAASPRAAGGAARIESTLERGLGRHGARSWTFITRRSAQD